MPWPHPTTSARQQESGTELVQKKTEALTQELWDTEPQHSSWKQQIFTLFFSFVQTHFMLHHIPGFSDPLVPWHVEVPHPRLHLGPQEDEHLGPQQPDRPDSYCLDHDDGGEEGGVEEHELPVGGEGTHTAQGGHEEEEATKTGENDGEVEKVVAEEVKMMTVGALQDQTTDGE